MNRYGRWCRIYTALERWGHSALAEDETYRKIKKHIQEAMVNEMMQPWPEGADLSASAEMVVEISRIKKEEGASNE
jgi:hypothetical protein